MTFNHLTIISRVANDRNGRVMVLVRCDCPEQKELTVRLSDLKGGEDAHTKSCGCARVQAIRRRCGKVQFRRFGCYIPLGRARPDEPMSAEATWLAFCYFCLEARKLTTSQVRSGKYRCPCLVETYASWRNMVQRCTNEKHDQYGDYGGRGIGIDESWTKFAAFLLDMDKRPPGTTLDRIDVNGDYNRENCRWATAEEQALNRRPAARY